MGTTILVGARMFFSYYIYLEKNNRYIAVTVMILFS